MKTGLRWVLAFVAALALITQSGPSHALVASSCPAVKLRACNKAFSCRIRELSKLVRGRDADLSRCDEKLTARFAKIDAKGGCVITGDAATATARVTNAAEAVFDDLGADVATESQIRCLVSKAKESAEYSACQTDALVWRLSGRDLTNVSHFATCVAHHNNGFMDAEGSGDCATLGDASAVRNSVGGAYGYLPSVDWGLGEPSNGYFASAQLPNADLSNNDLSYADFDQADLAGADLTGSNLAHSKWDSADLTSANLSGANLSDSEFSHLPTHLSGANLGTTDLTGLSAEAIDSCPASLPPGWQCRLPVLAGPTARLTYVDLTGVDLSGTDLSNATLTGSTLTNANLTGTSFAGATLTGVGWSNTTCPDGQVSAPSCCNHLIDVPASCSP